MRFFFLYQLDFFPIEYGSPVYLSILGRLCGYAHHILGGRTLRSRREDISTCKVREVASDILHAVLIDISSVAATARWHEWCNSRFIDHGRCRAEWELSKAMVLQWIES